jgi:geranylgeranyl diphosphate synthase type II
MFDLKKYLAGKKSAVNRALENILLQESTLEKQIVSAIRHSLMPGGKRLRPVLCLSAAEIVGGNEDRVMDAACSLEMIHTYSLIHDDLPAMDDDDLRRGKQTCHIAFDEATAILAGDALLTLAFEVLSKTNHAVPQDYVVKKLDVIHKIASAAGYRGMISGQMADILSEGKKLNMGNMKRLHFAKTGALIEASVYAGAVLGDGTRDEIEALTQYARTIGLAFQVADDILNVQGDPKIMGKAAGTDKKKNKSTYPSLMGIEKSKRFAEKLVDESLNAIEIFDKKAEPLRAIARYIIERKR